MDYQRLFVEHLTTIERVVRTIARRHRLPAAEHDDFLSLVRLRIMDCDYRVLRSFSGRSAIGTYLTIVISRLFLDYRNQQWGRWRPSARARRLGREAVLLDRLVTRDGHTLDEAIEILRTNHQVSLPETRLRALWDALPPRHPVIRVREELADQADGGLAPASELAGEGAERARIGAALGEAVAALTPGDRILVSLHVVRGVSLSDIARQLGVSKATVNRRLVRALAACRSALEATGVTRDRLSAIAQEGRVELPDILDALLETDSDPGRLMDRDE